MTDNYNLSVLGILMSSKVEKPSDWYDQLGENLSKLGVLHTILSKTNTNFFNQPDKYQELLSQLLDKIASSKDSVSYLYPLLLHLIIRTEDEDLRQKELNLLRLASQSPQINFICHIWITTRHPDLEQLLLEKQWIATWSVPYKVLTILKTGKLELLHLRERREIRALVEALGDRDAVIAANARKCLEAITEESGLDLVAVHWVEKRWPLLLDLLLKKDYLPRRPPDARVRVALKCGKLEILTKSKSNLASPLVEATLDSDPEIAAQAQKALGQLKKREAQETLCEQIIKRNLPQAQEAALQAGYLPAETYQRTIYYFVTEQWERYEALDFDYQILRTAYETAEPAMRRRLAEKVRAAGRVEYLTALAGGDYRSRTAKLTLEEAKLLVQVLAANRDWGKLWSLVFEMPLEWSVAAISHLAQATWQPQDQESQTLFEQLSALALKPMITDEAKINQLLPPAIFRAQARVSGRINALAFSPSRPLLAIGTGAGKVVVWNLQEAKREQVLSGFEHSIGQLTFTPGDRLACAETTNSSTGPCGVYTVSSQGELLKLGQHNGPVTALQVLDNEQLVSAGRDCRLVQWNLKEASLVKELVLNHSYYGYSWARGLSLSPNKEWLVVLNPRLVVVSLKYFTVYRTRSTKLAWAVEHAAFPTDSETLVMGGPDGQLTTCSLSDNSRFGEKPAEVTLSKTNKTKNQPCGPTQGLSKLPTLPILALATADGKVAFVDWEKQAAIGQVEVPGERLTSLCLSPDGYFMAVGDRNAAFSLWDLRILELRRLFSRPLAQGKALHLAALAILRESNLTLPPAVETSLRFIELILHHRLRHDIELDEIVSIQPGDFDIEIE